MECLGRLLFRISFHPSENQVVELFDCIFALYFLFSLFNLL